VHWKVKIIVEGQTLDVISRTEPTLVLDSQGRVSDIVWSLVHDIHGGTVGFLDWPRVAAVTWCRIEPEAAAPSCHDALGIDDVTKEEEAAAMAAYDEACAKASKRRQRR
jgi:hypothetical protein